MLNAFYKSIVKPWSSPRRVSPFVKNTKESNYTAAAAEIYMAGVNNIWACQYISHN